MREAPYIILILLVIIGAALFLGSSDPISVATGRAEANALLSDVPAGGWLASQFTGALFKIVLSGVVLGIAGVFIAQARKWLRDREYQPKWKGGPNANFQTKATRQPKAMDANQMLQLAMIERLTPSSKQEPYTPAQQPFVRSQQPQVEESLDLRF